MFSFFKILWWEIIDQRKSRTVKQLSTKELNQLASIAPVWTLTFAAVRQERIDRLEKGFSALAEEISKPND